MYSYVRSFNIQNYEVNLEKDVTYFNQNRLIWCNDSYYIDETDHSNDENFLLETTKSPNLYGSATRHFVKYQGMLEYEDVWSTEMVDETFCFILQDLFDKGHIPPLITIKPNSTISLIQFNEEVTEFHITLNGMMNPSKPFSDYQMFSIYLQTIDGLIHCYNCGWLYNGHAQCDCICR